MSTIASSLSSSSLARFLPPALLGAGAVAVLVALWLLWSALSTEGASPTDQAARNSIEQIGATLTEVNQILAQPGIRDRARQVLAGSSEVQALRRDLQSAGVTNLLDVRVFPPGVEDIEIGTYPEPDFSVIQMLLEARRQGAAPAEVHYPGTANENLAFARAIPAENAGEDGSPAGYLFIRRPVSVITRRLAQPGPGGWLALQQDKTVIASNGSLPQERVPDGQATIADSRLRLHWTAGQGAGGASLLSGALIALLGLLLIGGGMVLQRRTAAGAVGDPPEEQEHSPTQSPGADPHEPAQATQASDKQTERSRRDRPDADQDSRHHHREDLPEWMLDEQSGHRRSNADTPPQAGQDKATDDSFDDVPNLEEIYRQIDAEKAGKPEPEASSGSDANTLDDGGRADARPPELDDDEGLIEIQDFDLGDDDGGDEASADVPQRPESAAAESAAEEEAPPRDLDLDFAFSDGTRQPDQEAGADSDEAMQEPPSGEGLDLALEDDGPLPPRDTAAADVDKPAAAASAAEDGAAGAASAPEPVELPSGVFRPSDILGVVDEDLTAEAATDIGQALGSLIAERGFQRVAVARDGRFSGPIMLSAVIRGLRNSGINVIEVGAVPTPLLWFAATELAEGCGVMVTASHHPPSYNGFRAMIGGDLIDPGTMVQLARRVAQKDFVSGDGSYEQQDILERYTTRLTADIQIDRPVKVVVDCGNGVGGAAVPKLLQAIGADLIPLYCDVDGAFPNHRPDPSSPDDLEDLRLCVRNFQAELGIAFDGDADRLALVTRSGEIVWPERLLMLLAADVLATRPGEAVIFDVRSSGHVQRVIERAGGRGLMTASGQQPVAQRLRKESAPLGGDMSGHLFINDRWYPFDDAVYAAARLLEILAADARDLEEMLAEQPQYRVSPEIVVEVEREQALALIERMSESGFGDALVTRIDGVRADWSDRWGLARVDADSGRLILRFGADEATALGRVRSEFRDKLLELEPKLPLPY